MRMRLLRLPGACSDGLRQDPVGGHARAVASLEDPVQQERLADRIVAEGLTVRMAEELAQRIKNGEPLLGPDERAGFESGRPCRPRGWRNWPSDSRTGWRPGSESSSVSGKGKVLIEFATLDDLQRICDAIGSSSETW
jgi:ParB family chromosome partitioning protein